MNFFDWSRVIWENVIFLPPTRISSFVEEPELGNSTCTHLVDGIRSYYCLLELDFSCNHEVQVILKNCGFQDRVVS